MNTISEIPLEEMLQDREASVAAIAYCKHALSLGVTRYGGPDHNESSVQECLDANVRIIATIDAELTRRGVQIVRMTEPPQ